MARHGMAWHGTARHGMALHGMAWQGANQAVAAAKMGAPVSFAGVFGGDSHGRMLRETMHQGTPGWEVDSHGS